MRCRRSEADHVKRLARHLFTFCSVVSLVLCVAVCVLWVRSYWAADNLFRRGQTSWIAHSNCGEVTVTAADLTGVSPDRGSPPPFYVRREAHARSRAATQTDPGVTIDFDFGGFAWLVTKGGTVATPGRTQAVPPPLGGQGAALVPRAAPCVDSRGTTAVASATQAWNLRRVRLRPPRQPRAMPGMRRGLRSNAAPSWCFDVA
jgi:hypothetical protein